MLHLQGWDCPECGREVNLPDEHAPMRCVCGGFYQRVGREEYDQEYADVMNARADHRYDEQRDERRYNE